MFDKPHEECGVFGIYNKNQFNAVHLTYLALYALQHRGQISCGIATIGAVWSIITAILALYPMCSMRMRSRSSPRTEAEISASAMCAIRPAACQSAKILSPL